MLDIIVKTIDGQNRSYSVPDDYTVKQFKEKIANSMNIPVERQRLIFQGRELRDANLLSDFDVNGKTLHLVQRVPPTNISRPSDESNATTGQSATFNNLGPSVTGGIGVNQAGNLNQDVQQIINQLLGGLGEFGQNATFNANTNGDANGMEVHIDLGNVSQLVNENEIRSRIRNIRRFLNMAQSRLNRIEEIQSGAPLNDAPQHSTIIVGSIETTTINGNEFDALSASSMPPTPHHNMLHHPSPITTTQRIVTTSIPLSSLLNNQQVGSTTSAAAAPPTHLITSDPLQPSNLTASTTTTTTNTSETSETSQSQQQQQQQQQESISVQILAELTRSVMDSYARFQPFLEQYHEMLVNDASEPTEEPSNTNAASSQAPTSTTTTTSTNNEDGSVTTTKTTKTTTTTTTTSSSSSSNPNTATATATTTPTSTATATSHQPNVFVLGDNRRQRFFNNINDMMHLLGHLFHNLSDLHVNIRDRPPRQIHTMSSMQHSTSAIISAIPIEASINISNLAPTSFTSTTSAQPPLHQQPPLVPQFSPHFPIPPQLRARSGFNQGVRLTRSFVNRPPMFNRPTTPNTNNTNTNTNTTTTGTTTTTRTTTTTNTTPIISATSPQVQPSLTTHPASFTPPAAQPHHVHQFAHHQQLQRPHHHHRNPIPNQIRMQRFVRPDLQQMSTLNSYDQYLPCNSVHFYNSANPVIQQQLQASANASTQMYAATQRRRHPAGDQNQHQSPQTQEPTAAPPLVQPGNDIHRMLNNIISTTIRNSLGENLGDMPQAQARIHVNIATSRGDSGSNSSPATNTPMSTPISISPGGRGVSGSNIGVGGSPASFLVGGSSANPPPQIFGQLLSDLLGSTSASSATPADSLPFNPFNPTESQLNQPLTELMRMFGTEDTDLPPAESSLNIFNVFFQSLRIGDMMDLARGQNRENSFERARQPLRDYLRNTYSIGSFENDREAVENLVNRLYMDIFVLENMGGLNLNLNQLFIMTQTSIDFPKSFEKLVKFHLKKIIQHILEHDSTSSPTISFSLGLFNRLNTFLNELVTLGRVCIGGSALRQTSSAADEQIVQVCVRKLREMLVESSSSNIGAFFGFFESFIQSKMQQILLSINLEQSVIEDYLVYKPNQTLENNNNAEQLVDDDQYDSASSTLSGNSIDMDQHFSQFNQASTLRVPKTTPSQHSILINERQETIPTSSSSSWQNSFPPQWLPIIESDVEKMSNTNQSTFTTYSDAYVNGMPSKRRKLLFSKNDLLTKNLFKRVLSRTLQKIQLKDTASNIGEEQILNQSLTQSRLIDSFDTEFDMAITDRLRHDAEFNEITQKSKSKEKDSNGDDNDEMTMYNKDRFQNSKKRFN